ncbi:PTS glucose/sucrose transporter subunit IIB [Anaerobacillus sp. CMMVII]|uniref:PTS glucose/sucrose transporter subunit IIB n=1 Tax=Anaerobacillus sp. CMMVII TaxID=2755588 RepID=UPI0021B71F97|nr:PTS glucose/sucrose transporter subunit IIB [Anaerobacillus sp. CMMVII]MCT8137156.1 PTS glucose/sucrose transporter subunit IIB [Anaerobacillus sp. CMMVII]
MQKKLLTFVGGRQNIIATMHCSTRLRLGILDENRINKNEIEQLVGVHGVYYIGGQFQIVFGTETVKKYMLAFANELSFGSY